MRCVDGHSSRNVCRIRLRKLIISWPGCLVAAGTVVKVWNDLKTFSLKVDMVCLHHVKTLIE